MEVLVHLFAKGVIRAIGVSNFNVEQASACMDLAPIHTLQPPYNLFERGIEADLLPFCRERGIAVLSYGGICRGLLSGKFKPDSKIKKGDIRAWDPKFKRENLPRYVNATRELQAIADEKKAKLAQLAIRWATTRPGITSALVGARDAVQSAENAGAFEFDFTDDDATRMERFAESEVPTPIGPEFMAPPRTAP